MTLYNQVRGRGFPLLCLHGHPGSGQALVPLAEGLGSRYRAILPDLRGYGRSPAPAPFTLNEHLADLVALLDHYQIEQCAVLGWSLGGILALELALQYPERVKALVMIAAAARPVGNHPPLTLPEVAYSLAATALNLAAPGHPWVVNHWGRRSLYRYLVGQHTPLVYRRLGREGASAYLRTSVYARRALERGLQQGYNRLDALAELVIPTLILCGDQDRHITALASQETANYLPHSNLRCYPQTGHLIPWEQPEAVLNDVGTWLDHHVP